MLFEEIMLALFSEVGDDTRRWGPPFLGSESCYYLCVNRNKKVLNNTFILVIFIKAKNSLFLSKVNTVKPLYSIPPYNNNLPA